MRHAIITSVHRTYKAFPKITDWFFIVQNLSRIWTPMTCDAYQSHLVPRPERYFQNKIVEAGLTNIPIDNLAYIQRASYVEYCSYFCTRPVVSLPVFICNTQKRFKPIYLGVFDVEWNKQFQKKMMFALHNFDIIKFDIGSEFKNWSCNWHSDVKMPIVKRPYDIEWNWNTFCIYNHAIFHRLLLPPDRGISRRLDVRMKEIAPYCSLQFRKEYSNINKLFRNACDA